MAATMLDLTGKSVADWEEALWKSRINMITQAETQVDFWQMEKKRIKALSHEEATDMLIGALKIDSKIEVIAKTAGLDL